MAQIIGSFRNLTKAGVEIPAGVLRALGGVFGLASPAFELGAKTLGGVDKVLGGGDSQTKILRRSERLKTKLRINYSPKRATSKMTHSYGIKHLKRAAGHLKNSVTILKSPGRPKK